MRTMRTPIRKATHAMDLDTARKRPIMLSLRSTFLLLRRGQAAISLDVPRKALDLGGILGMGKLDGQECHHAGAEGQFLHIGKRDHDHVAIDDRV